jgi:hypothetical protein
MCCSRNTSTAHALGGVFYQGDTMQEMGIEETGYKQLWQKFVYVSIALCAAGIVGVPVGLIYLYRASAETRRAAQANLLAQLHAEYASLEMTKAMRNLYRWREDHPEDFAETFIDLYKKRDPRADDLDADRRYVYRFFAKIHLLINSNLIDSDFVDLVTFTSVGGRFLTEVLEPIQEAHGRLITHTNYDKQLFDYYRRP